jgi:hypothetical protein
MLNVPKNMDKPAYGFLASLLTTSLKIKFRPR